MHITANESLALLLVSLLRCGKPFAAVESHVRE
jgi:hypothetical protein